MLNNITNIKFTLRFLYLAKKKRVKEVGSGYEMFSRFGSGSVFSPRLVSGSATLLQICQFHTLSFPDNAINIITAINFCQKKTFMPHGARIGIGVGFSGAIVAIMT